MPKEIFIQEKREWLEKYEQGTSMKSLADRYKRSQITIKKGLEDARRDRDSQFARVELMKEALKKHQLRLQEGLQQLIGQLTLPDDFTPLSWYEGKNSIFDKFLNPKKLHTVPGLSQNVGRPSQSNITVNEMLRQHFRGDTTWKLLVEWEKTVIVYADTCLRLQQQIVELVAKETGYSFESKSDVETPYLCSYTLGPLLYQAALAEAIGTVEQPDLKSKLVADTEKGWVKKGGTVFADVPGKEKECRLDIINAYVKIKETSAFQDIQSAHSKMREFEVKSRQAVDELSYLEYIPGVCNICKRLGM